MLATLSDWRGRSQSMISVAEFARDVANRIECDRSDLTVDVLDGILLLRAQDGRMWREDLSRAHELYIAEPRMRESLASLTAASICDRTSLPRDTTIQQVLPIIRRRETMEGSDAIFQPFARSLALTYIVERPTGHTLVTTQLQQQLTSSLRELQLHALKNLDRRIEEVSIDKVANGVSLVASDTLPASSLLFSRTFWFGSSMARASTPLCAIPSDPRTLVVFDSSIAGARDRALATALEVMDSSANPLTSEIVTLDEGYGG